MDRRFLFLILFLAPSLVFARVDKADLRIRVLYLGDASYLPNQRVLQWMMAEPKLSTSIVPCDTYFIPLPQARKMTRLYLPRTYNNLNASSDVVVLHNIPPGIIGNRVLGFIQKGIENDGIGLGLISYMFWGGGAGTNNIEIWKTLEFYDLFPADVVMNDIPSRMGRTYWSVVRKDPILNLPDIEKQPMQTLGNHGGDLEPRPGSIVQAVWRGRNTPVMVTGSYGSGKTLHLGQGWHNPPMEVFNKYRYMPDLLYNQLYFLAAVLPPADLELAHLARELFVDFRVRKGITISTMEFVDKFGAKLESVEDRLAHLDSGVVKAEHDYLSSNLNRATETLREAMDVFPEIEGELEKLRNQAMTWIHIFEWITVTLTYLICGSVLWTLMVRRKLHRSVKATRFQSRDPGLNGQNSEPNE